ncbi:hypothetical protein C8J57DRAFT_1482479 [Mycena rebaudengoi]|nr:hypothetical protein C8J57DRAFT_1482479 [Mycena rebaudengoi]
MPKQSAAHPPLCLLPSLSQSHTLESALQAPEPPFRLPQASLRRDLHSPPLRANFTYHSRPRPYPATRDPTTPRNPSVFQRPAMRTHGVLIRSPISSKCPTAGRQLTKPQHRLTGESLVLTLNREPNRTSRSSAPHDALSGFDVVVFAEAAVNLHAFKSRTYDLTCKIQQFKWPLVFPPRNYDLACMFYPMTDLIFTFSRLQIWNSDLTCKACCYFACLQNIEPVSLHPRYLVLQTKIHHGRTSRLTHVTTHL